MAEYGGSSDADVRELVETRGNGAVVSSHGLNPWLRTVIRTFLKTLLPSSVAFPRRVVVRSHRLHPRVTHCDPNLVGHVITEQRRVPSASVLLLLLLLPCCAFAIRT